MDGVRRGALMRSKSFVVVAAALVAALILPAIASAHIERASYWPDPAPDCSVSPCAGGEVPTARSLASAVVRRYRGPGVVRVVCQPDSVEKLILSARAAKKVGYVLRPTQPRLFITVEEKRALVSINKKLFKKCAY